MSRNVFFAFIIAVILWASAFVGIRAGLHYYSPEGLALLRYLIASLCMGFIYMFVPEANHRHSMNQLRPRDKVTLMMLGVVGIGFYNITLNRGEVAVESGIASFIVSQSPLITTLLAVIFLGEVLRIMNIAGLLFSVIGIVLIYFGERTGSVKWDIGMLYILIATIISGLYSILQKPILKRCHALHATAFIIWGATLFLLIYSPMLYHDFTHTTWHAFLIVAYLGIFPGALGYVCWNYGLSYVPAMRAASFLYFTPFIATFIGWIWLGEVPTLIAITGGIIAIAGVGLINRSFRSEAKLAKAVKKII